MNVTKELLAGVVTLGILAVTVAPVGDTDTALAASPGCLTAAPEQARALAAKSYRRGEYQRAGECYQAAGDLGDANEAFVKAVKPNSDATAKELHRQGRVAKKILEGVRRAFRSNH